MANASSTDEADATVKATFTLNATGSETEQHHITEERRSCSQGTSLCGCLYNYRRHLYRFAILLFLSLLVVLLETLFPAQAGAAVSLLRSAINQVQNGTHSVCAG